ncbi:MAG TPA: hypothetical protein VFJ17_06165 [Mycobacteriales bacterium]|jgi:hypothetical protein|nr:hypothetical protein [Mycobacteriales bacterium]
MNGRDYNAGTVDDDNLLHAAIGPRTRTVAACGAGRIRYAAPTPFVPGAEDFCPHCTAHIDTATISADQPAREQPANLFTS